jgi:ketosteroid isomerase-like protein
MNTDVSGMDHPHLPAEAGIRTTLEGLRLALHVRDADAFAALCTPELRVFDLDPPLQRHGATKEAQMLRDWFANWQGPIDDELHEVSVAAGDDVAFVAALSRLRATARDGSTTDMWSRVTFGLRRVDGRWLVAHRHASVPFHMDGSFRAATDLTP